MYIWRINHGRDKLGPYKRTGESSMDMQKSTNAQMRAVTISREYGSGGGEIARRLATKLGWRLVDHEIVAQVAHELDISVEEAESRDESAQSTVSLILNSMRAVNPAMFSVTP